MSEIAELADTDTWIKYPHECIKKLICSGSENPVEVVADNFKANINDTLLNNINLLNYLRLENVKDGRLVCYRGYIKDITNPALIPKNVILKLKNGQEITTSSILCDILHDFSEIVDFDTSNFIEFTEYIVSSAKSENQWVSEVLGEIYLVEEKCVTVPEIRLLNYCPAQEFKLGDLVEIFGLIRTKQDTTSDGISKLTVCVENIYTRNLNHLSPYIHQQLNYIDFEAIRNIIISILTDTFNGDRLSAEYALLSILSKNVSRTDQTIVGKFVANIVLPNDTDGSDEDIITKLMTFINSSCASSSILPVSHENLGNKKYYITKNNETDRLEETDLDVFDGMVLVVDETKLTEGFLAENGLKNVKFIKNVVESQIVSIDYTFFSLDYERNIKSLIISHEKSLITADVTVKNIPSTINHIHIPTEIPWEDIRKYLSYVPILEFSFDDASEKDIQEFYANPANKAKYELNETKLHTLLSMARIYANSFGCEKLELDKWNRIIDMDFERISRLKL